MPVPEHVLLFTRGLEHASLPYAITGATACILYGAPRLTEDVDLVLALRPRQAAALAAAFPAELFYCPPVEAMAMEAGRGTRGHFNLLHHGTGARADVYLVGNDPLHVWAIRDRRPVTLVGETVYVAPPEYVILRKLEYLRESGAEKHLRDLANMLAVSSASIACEQVEALARERGLLDLWLRVRAAAADAAG